MIRNLYIVLLLMMVGLVSNAQVTSGVKGGLVFSNLASFDASNLSTIANNTVTGIEDGRQGFFVGFFVGVPLSENLSFQPEFQYVQQGSDADVLRIDYLQMPLALHYDISESFFVNVGPQIGIRIWTPGDSGLINHFDYSIFGSLGFHITETFFIEGRYSLGLNDIAEGGRIPLDLNESLANPSFKNSYFYFGLGYKL